MITFTLFILTAVLYFYPAKDAFYYNSPLLRVPAPGHQYREAISSSRIVANIASFHDDFVSSPAKAVSDLYTDTFGQDLHFGWTDSECYTRVLVKYDWPFRSTSCVWFHSAKDEIIAYGCFSIAVILVILIIANWLNLLYAPILGRHWFSVYVTVLMRLVRQPVHHSSNVRNTFNNAPPVINPHIIANHSHPVAARARTTSSRQMELICSLLGTTPYFLQQSKSDQRRSTAGCRSFFWAKDVQADFVPYEEISNASYCMVDVDYYMDMPYVLGAYPGHYMISTFQPSSAAYSGKEYQFTFDSESRVKYTVNGGARYPHKVWNYTSDVIVARVRSWTMLWWYITTYTVDRRRIDDHHQIICLTPVMHLISPLFSLSSMLDGRVLERLDVVVGGFARIDVSNSSGLVRSTAVLGAYAETTVPVEVDDATASVGRTSNVHLSMAQIRTTTGITDPVKAAVLTEYHRTTTGPVPDVVMSPDESIFKYQVGLKDYDPTAKNKLRAFMSPIILGCYSPDECLANDKAAVKGRITDVRPPEDLAMTPFLQKCMQEFVELLIPKDKYQKHYPVDLEEVYERQKRPAQRALLKRAETAVGNPSDQPIQTFQKAEAYGKPGDPRIISTIHEIDKLHYSSFSYSFNACLRATTWYAFGLTPAEIAARVVAVCVAAIAFILNTDCSRMDGRVSKLLRILERMVMLAWFHPTCHKRLVELMETQQNKRAFTRFGVTYDTESARASGSAETADFNSMDTAFIKYCSYRKQGLSPVEAWAKIGIVGGDDGMTGDLDPDTLVSVGKSVGQVIEVVKVLRGDPGVQMLSREFGPHVWNGDPSSMCDIKRQLSKFHTAVNFLPQTVSPLHKFAVKAYSYSLSDANTPIIGELYDIVLKCFPELIAMPVENPLLRSKLATYFAYHPKDVQFPNKNVDDWMYDVIRRDLPTFDFLKFRKWVRAVVKGEANALSPPVCVDIASFEIPKQRTEVVVNGDVVSPSKDSGEGTGLPSDKPQPFKSKKGCNHFAKGKCTKGDTCAFSHAAP